MTKAESREIFLTHIDEATVRGYALDPTKNADMRRSHDVLMGYAQGYIWSMWQKYAAGTEDYPDAIDPDAPDDTELSLPDAFCPLVPLKCAADAVKASNASLSGYLMTQFERELAMLCGTVIPAAAGVEEVYTQDGIYTED